MSYRRNLSLLHTVTTERNNVGCGERPLDGAVPGRQTAQAHPVMLDLKTNPWNTVMVCYVFFFKWAVFSR